MREERDAFEAAADRDLRERLLRARQDGYDEAEAQWQHRTTLVRADRGDAPPRPLAPPIQRPTALTTPRNRTYAYQTDLTAERQGGTSGFIDRIVREHIDEPISARDKPPREAVNESR
ncbi:MAG: hypothetical protein O3B84_02350, partial [Chloroflexi bacterium]|nr:hypothetical protein [Chloroflexota bacterium]